MAWTSPLPVLVDEGVYLHRSWQRSCTSWATTLFPSQWTKFRFGAGPLTIWVVRKGRSAGHPPNSAPWLDQAGT